MALKAFWYYMFIGLNMCKPEPYMHLLIYTKYILSMIMFTSKLFRKRKKEQIKKWETTLMTKENPIKFMAVNKYT